MTPVDYAHTRQARENREAKATVLAATARSMGVTTAGIQIGGGRRRGVWRAAGLERSPSEETWHLVHQLLAADPPTPALATARGCKPCNTPGCQAPDTHLYPSGWWCDPHSPWGRRGLAASDPNRVPGQPCELTRLRQARGITAAAYATPAMTVVDERAIASGKRRSTTATYQAVKAAQEHRNRTRRNP
ncbi:MAG: hypothetical protein NVV66_18515 [Cellulomonas sp.]|uniref:hypothetical protein n=1 Tax=Cellulomonas sp. TaxID=40001 RepID=UPI002588ACFA|nr:hypothetical protein [Cellulomonas sp.]MCR6706591.1 hypothetical protein [Cellulomonas sp.]